MTGVDFPCMFLWVEYFIKVTYSEHYLKCVPSLGDGKRSPDEKTYYPVARRSVDLFLSFAPRFQRDRIVPVPFAFRFLRYRNTITELDVKTVVTAAQVLLRSTQIYFDTGQNINDTFRNGRKTIRFNGTKAWL
jgi:hypothetical protein